MTTMASWISEQPDRCGGNGCGRFSHPCLGEGDDSVARADGVQLISAGACASQIGG
jgi:hypothetical protein